MHPCRQVPGYRFGRAVSVGLCVAVLTATVSTAAADTTPPPAAGAADRVHDLALLLAVDVSRSVDGREYRLQTRGLSRAFRHPDVLQAIRVGAPNGVTVALMHWSGPGEQTVSVPWTTVTDDASADRLAGRIDLAPRPPTDGGTALDEALAQGLGLLASDNVNALRRVIDVSGDGGDNRGGAPAETRSTAVAAGLVINGLAIVNDEPYLAGYYATNVIGGAGAFVVQARSFRDFGRAIRLKLIREISGAVVTRREAAAPGAVADAND